MVQFPAWIVQTLKTKTIGVLMGGLSGEREISLRSGENCLRALLSRGYRAVRIDAVRDVAQRLDETGVEVAFLALHGRYGEDGTIQGLLEMMGIPYTGSGVLASALGMNKIAAKKVVRGSGVPTPDYCEIGADEPADSVAARVEAELGLPVMLKPVEEGSSLGVSKCKRSVELAGLRRAGAGRVRGDVRRTVRLRSGDNGGGAGARGTARGLCPSWSWCPRTSSTTTRPSTPRA